MSKGSNYYIIGKEDVLLQVSEDEYKVWDELFGDEYSLPDYFKADNHIFFSIETMFHGVEHENEELLPYLIFYFEGKLVITDDGVEREHIKDDVFNFRTFEEMTFVSSKIIQVLEK